MDWRYSPGIRAPNPAQPPAFFAFARQPQNLCTVSTKAGRGCEALWRWAEAQVEDRSEAQPAGQSSTVSAGGHRQDQRSTGVTPYGSSGSWD